MKKIIVIAALLAVSCCAYCQQKDTVKKSSVKVEKVDAKTFKATKAKKSKEAKDKYASYLPTGYFLIDTDGKRYEIYSHKLSRGANAGQTCYYIFRISGKTGNPYPKKVEVQL